MRKARLELNDRLATNTWKSVDVEVMYGNRLITAREKNLFAEAGKAAFSVLYYFIICCTFHNDTRPRGRPFNLGCSYFPTFILEEKKQ